MKTLKIENLHVNVGDLEILKGINLTVHTGEIHALIGPNGHGKSTLLGTLMGNPKYQVMQGTITLDGEDVLAMSVDERARKGLFLAMQYPQEIPGVTVSDFLKEAINVRRETPVSLYKFVTDLEKATQQVGLPLDIVHRFINEGFSGGEKKRNEVLQMMMLKPDFALLDEIDSGLDVDALKIIADAINNMRSNSFGCVIVSHYARLYQLITPSHVHIIINGRIITSGGQELVEKIDQEGYEWMEEEFQIKVAKESKQTVQSVPLSLGSCGVKVKAEGSQG